MTSELRTKKGRSSLPRIFSASLSGPAVPKGSVSTENSILTLYSFSYYDPLTRLPAGWSIFASAIKYLFQGWGHDVRTVVHSQNDVSHTCGRQCLDLMEDHRLVREFDQRLWKCKGLYGGQMPKYWLRCMRACSSLMRCRNPVVKGGIPKGAGGCHNRQRGWALWTEC